MKLRHSYDSKEAIPAELLDYYVEKNGKWVLQSEDSDAALGTLEKERERRTQIEKELAELRKKADALKDIDPERYQKLVELEERLDREKAESKGNYEKLLEIERGKWEKEKAKLLEDLKGSDSYIEKLLVDQAIGSKLAKVKPAFRDAAIALLREQYKPTVVKDGNDRKPIATVDGAQVELATALDGWLSGDIAKEFLLAESNAGGGNTPGRPGIPAPAAGKLSPEQAASLSPADYAKARKEGRIG